VINPTGDLPFAPFEGEQIERLFPNKQSGTLPGSGATAEAIKQSVACYLHFAGHGFYRWEDPMQSGLFLADREALTLAQIIGELNLDAIRLVTVPACETGLTDIVKAPDEYLGLPAGFLQAGAPAVVSILWAVNDLSTMLLIERFYDLHLNEGKELADAFRDAQIWLSNLTADELAERFGDEVESAMSGDPRIPLETASTAYVRFAFQDAANRPFAHPFHWAAFTFSGA
jgi:CHAT domain-containing protein